MKYHYFPETKEELREILKKLIKERGPEGDFNDIYTGDITDMSRLFNDFKLFNGNISNWNVSNVENMRCMFDGCKDFNQNIGRWNVSNVEDMCEMFRGCEKFNKQDLSCWNIDTRKTDTRHMFNDCNSSCPIPSWYKKSVNESFEFDDADEDDSQDSFFNVADTLQKTPKILRWLLSYGVNVDNISVKVYNGQPGIFVNGDLNLSNKGITHLPYKFIEVAGSLNLSNNKLTSCKNLPIFVGGKLNINKNFIRSFEGLPTRTIGFSIEADRQKCKTLYPLTDANARICIKNGSDEKLRKNRVRVETSNENYNYGTIVGLNESATVAYVVLDGTDRPTKFSTDSVYPLEKHLI